jgi:hypothetical protein
MDFFHEYGGDPLKPSLFELVAQEQLRDLLQPALKYVLSVSPSVTTSQYTDSTDTGISTGFRPKTPEIPSTDSQQARGVLRTHNDLR